MLLVNQFDHFPKLFTIRGQKRVEKISFSRPEHVDNFISQSFV